MTTEPSHHGAESSDDSAATARVLLAEDDVLLREGLASLLERSGFEVVGQTGDSAWILPLVRELTPDLVVLDIRMPPTNTAEGLDAAREIRHEFPETGILVLSAHAEVEHAMELLATGQRIGYLLKSRVTDVDEFIETLERIVKGGSVMDPALVQELVSARRRNDPLAVLSPREHEVLGADGRRPVQRRHRPPAVGDRGHRREARPEHPREAQPPRDRRRSPPGARRGRLPRRPLT